MASEENVNERNKVIDDAGAVYETVNTRGWQTVIGPRLKEKRDNLIEQFKDAKEHIDLMYLQQAICAIDHLKIFIEEILAEGKEALIEEREEKKRGK